MQAGSPPGVGPGRGRVACQIAIPAEDESMSRSQTAGPLVKAPREWLRGLFRSDAVARNRIPLLPRSRAADSAPAAFVGPVEGPVYPGPSDKSPAVPIFPARVEESD